MAGRLAMRSVGAGLCFLLAAWLGKEGRSRGDGEQSAGDEALSEGTRCEGGADEESP